MRFSWTPVFIIVALAGVLGFFQNCTPAVPFGNTDYFQSLVNTPNWPYEVSVDQLAYMSCSEQEDVPNDGTFFTFRVGAFHSGGIRIAETYRQGIRNVRNDSVPLALSQSTASSRTRLTTAVRTIDNLQLIYRDEDNGQDGLVGSDFDYFFPVMGNEELNNILWYMEPGDYLRVFPAAQFIEDYRFEGELRFMKSQLMENDLRTFFSSRGIITVTWAVEGQPDVLGPGSLQLLQQLSQQGEGGSVYIPPVGTDGSTGAGETLSGSASGGGSISVPGDASSGANGSVPSGSGTTSVASFQSADFQAARGSFQAANNDLTQNVFGTAIQPRFKQPGVNPGPDLPPRVLSSVTDVTIDDRMRGQRLNPWSCPNSMQFMIVLPEDAIYQDANSNTIVRCATEPDPVELTPELEILRQSIYAEDFYIDMVRRCVVPKPNHTSIGSCYGRDPNTQLTRLINYDSFALNGCGFGNPNGLCPHYVSVCFRQ